MSPAGGSGCGRCGGASWKCSRFWSCCSGFAWLRRSQVRTAGTRIYARQAARTSALCADLQGSLWRWPPYLQPVPASVPRSGPGSAHAHWWPAGGRRRRDGVGPGPCVLGVPRRPFIFRLLVFAPPLRTAGSREWAGLGMVRDARAMSFSRPGQTWATVLGSWCVRRSPLRAVGQRGAGPDCAGDVFHSRWLQRLQSIHRPPAGALWPSLGSSLPAPEWPQWIAPPSSGSDRAQRLASLWERWCS